MEEQQRWHHVSYEGYGAVAVDTTPFWRPKLQGLQSKFITASPRKPYPLSFSPVWSPRIGEGGEQTDCLALFYSTG